MALTGVWRKVTSHTPLVDFLCATQVMNIGFHEIYPLWALAPLDSGGLDWSLGKVGHVRKIFGCAATFRAMRKCRRRIL